MEVRRSELFSYFITLMEFAASVILLMTSYTTEEREGSTSSLRSTSVIIESPTFEIAFALLVI